MSAAPPDPQPFVPTADAIHGRKRQWTHPVPQSYTLPRSMSSNTISHPPILQSTAGPIPMHSMPPPRGVLSQSAVPYPHPEHAAALQMRLPPRPLGHGRSGSSQPAFALPPPIAIPVLPTDAKPVNQHPTEKDLPKAPATGGLGLFVRNEPQTPIQQPLPPNPPVIVPVPPTSAPLNPLPPPPAPVHTLPSDPQQPRPRPTRRNTVSECQRLPTPEASEDAIHKEHVRLDALWEQEQEQLRREMDDERKKYEAKLRSMGQEPPKPRKKSKSPSAHPAPRHSDSPVMNEHGIPSPPPSGSPPLKAHKSTHDERERWRQEIRRVMEDQAQKQEIAKQEFVRAMHAQEQERLMRENYLRHQARLQAEAQAKARALEYEQHQQQYAARHPLPPTRDAPYPAPPRAQYVFAPIPSRPSRSRRKAQRESGYASGGARSTDGRSATNQNWRSTRPKRYYGEGTTDLRDEGMDGSRFEEVDDSWEDVESPGAQEARMVKAAWDLYESRWNQLTTVSPPKENSLRFIDIPWPSMEPLTGPCTSLPPSALQINSVLNKAAIGKFLLSTYHSEGKSAKTRLRAALLRFHPDKVRPWMNLIRESERNAVIMGVEIVVRCLNDLAKTAA